LSSSLSSGTLVTLSHTNNGFFKILVVLLRIHPCFISRSITLHAFRSQQTPSRCITCQDVCGQQAHAAKRLLPLFEVNLRRFVTMLLLRNKDQ